MQSNNKLLLDLINKYNGHNNVSDTNVELEIRIKNITFELFSNVYTAIISNISSKTIMFHNPTVETTINIISENIYERGSKKDDTKYIRRMEFKQGKFYKETYHTKTPICKSVYVNDFMKYVVGLSEEKNIKEFSSNVGSLVRIKNRVSFDYGVKQPYDWRFDITAVKTGRMSDMGPMLKTYCGTAFAQNVNHINYLQKLNTNITNTFELEIEYIGKKPINIGLFDVVKVLFSMAKPNYLEESQYANAVYDVAKILYANSPNLIKFKQEWGQKQLLNQALSISKNTYYSLWPIKNYYITEKTDGLRVLVSVMNKNLTLIYSDKIERLGDVQCYDMMLDGEYLDNTVNVFDILMVDGKLTVNDSFELRISKVSELKDITAKLPVKITYKQYIYVEKPDDIKQIVPKLNDKTDGIIIVEPGKSYKDTKNYKWKPFDLNTIDFMVVKPPSKMMGIKPYIDVPGYELFILFVGIRHEMRVNFGMGLLSQYNNIFPDVPGEYYPIHFCPSAHPLAYIYYHNNKLPKINNNDIVELSRASNAEIESNIDHWKFHKIRQDRKHNKNYYGNDFKTAELIYNNVIDEFKLEDLWTSPSSYFNKHADEMYSASNKYKRYIISSLFTRYLKHLQWVVDIAAGRGADLHRYQEIGVENCLFIDRDKTAIAELINRKLSYVPRRYVGGNSSPYVNINGIEYPNMITKDNHNMTTHILVADLKTPYDQLLSKCLQFGVIPDNVNAIVCNFALHYMCDTHNSLHNVLKYVSKLLCINGLFIFTVLDGQSVFNVLAKNNGNYQLYDNDRLKFGIYKKFKSDKLADVGQIIETILPFSGEKYEEPICNIQYVVEESKKFGFELLVNESMADNMENFATVNKLIYNKLTHTDKEYIQLYHYVVLKKIKQSKSK